MKPQHTIQKTTCIALLLLLIPALPLRAAEESGVHAVVTYQIPEGIYVNAGTERGLQKGLRGSAVLGNGQAVDFEVVQAARNTALIRLDGYVAGTASPPLRDQPITLSFNAPPQAPAPATAATTTTGESTEPFVPLLAPQPHDAHSRSLSSTSYGHVGIQQSFQTSSDSRQQFAVTRFNTSGTLERILETPWSFVWSGNARYRTGEAYKKRDDYQTIQPYLYRASLERPMDIGGFLRIGRFLPLELPAIGYLDGAQLEFHRDGPWRAGIAGGLKPDRQNLDFSAKEPTLAAYLGLETGTRGKAYYSGTAGLLGAFYDGQADRLAALLDQRIDFGPRLNIYSTAEFDFGVADTTNSTAQLTRLDLTASLRIHKYVTLRAGLDHWQRPDTHAQRDLLEVIDSSLFDNGYWRYWVGGQHNLPWKLRLNEEIAYTVSDASDNAARWRLGMTRTGLFAWRSASVTASFYNLEFMGSGGYGGLLSAYLPFWQGRFTVRPAAGLRWLSEAGLANNLEVTYYSIYLDGNLFKSWALTGGITVTQTDGADAALIDLGLRYKW